MIIIPKKDYDAAQLENLIAWLKDRGLEVHISKGENLTVIGLIGDTSKVDIDLIRSLDVVEDVKRIQEPFKNANRKFHPQDTVVNIGGVKIGGGNFQFIAGPCSVESENQIIGIAKAVKAAGAKLLRGEGIRLLLEAKKETGLPIVTEIMDISQLPLFEEVDVLQVGARNMQNFELLKELGRTEKPILLKRGMSSTLQELVMSAEYIMAGGNENVILCERGIRTFETSTRNTLDLCAIPVLKSMTHLPVVVDPSHATGYAKYVRPMSLAAAAAGADGLIIEVHNDPQHALCDGQQSITPEAFASLAENVEKILPFAAK